MVRRDDTALQTQDSKYEHWLSEAEHATFRPWRLPQSALKTRKAYNHLHKL